MNNIRTIIASVIAIIILNLCFYLSEKNQNRNGKTELTRLLSRAGIFAAISTILYCIPIFNFSIPGFPPFLKIHLDEIPAFIASFAYGPLCGILVIIIKTIIKLPLSSTMCVGELSDLIYSLVFILPAAIIYKNRRNFKSAILGIGIGLVLQLFIAILMNIYVMVPFYEFVMGYEEGALLGWMKSANSNITNIGWSYGLIAVLPFNLIKDAIVIAATLLIYKPLRRIIEKIKVK